jgi:hypothetical protein
VATRGSSQFSYSDTSDQYSYVWKTSKSWATSCRLQEVKLDDGSVHSAFFEFK